MNILLLIVFILEVIIGGFSVLISVVGIPAILIWKIYRKAKHNIPLTK